MKKKAVVLFAGLLACSAMLGGCGGNQASNDYVKVGGYKGIEVDKVEDKQEVSDEDVDNYIQAVRQQNMFQFIRFRIIFVNQLARAHFISC